MQADNRHLIVMSYRVQVQRMREDLAQTSADKQEQESTIIEQQDHIEKLQDSCRELQEAAQALKEDGEQKYAASLVQSKQDRKEQVPLRYYTCMDQSIRL